MELVAVLKDALRPAYRSLLATLHAGSRCRCNLCGKSFSRMKPPIGVHSDGTTFKRTDGGAGNCWKCNSYPRVRAIWHWLENDFKIGQRFDLSLLHIAPEEQLAQKLRIMPGIHYTAVDKFTPGYHYADYVMHADLLELPFQDETFDMVICNHVLEHIKDDVKAMAELYRLLKPGGIAIVMTPMDLSLEHSIEEGPDEVLSDAEREKRFGQYDHVRIYGMDYFERLRQVGFTVDRKKMPDNVVNELELDAEQDVVIATKGPVEIL